MASFIRQPWRISNIAGMVFLLFLCVASDQLTKQFAESYLSKRAPLSFLYDTLRLGYVENSGGFLSLLAGLPEDLRFIVLTCGVSVLLLFGTVFVLATRWLGRTAAVLATLILGGGIGNLIDRLINEGKVIDFLNIGLGGFRTGIFNLADVYILFGSFALGVLAARGELRGRGR